MQLSIRLVTRPHPGSWPRVLVTILVIVIISGAGWAWNGPAGIIVAVLACGGALTPLVQRITTAGVLGAGR